MKTISRRRPHHSTTYEQGSFFFIKRRMWYGRTCEQLAFLRRVIFTIGEIKGSEILNRSFFMWYESRGNGDHRLGSAWLQYIQK